MSKVIKLLNTKIENNRLILSIDTENITEFHPTGQMLVDSDNVAFIYIMEYQNEYVWLSLPHDYWVTINEGRIKQLQVLLQNSKTSIELPSFMEELDYLIDNIKDNANYGEEMVSVVEKVFL
ncbi:MULTISPECIES: hypothetical protein [Bacillus]|uniref:UPF0738 family protein n=1 Tax=Bacillus TaxID=1386 RepID=UPI0002ECBFBC|nr:MULTISPECIES: hypothetical protein [Bacillus]